MKNTVLTGKVALIVALASYGRKRTVLMSLELLINFLTAHLACEVVFGHLFQSNSVIGRPALLIATLFNIKRKIFRSRTEVFCS